MNRNLKIVVDCVMYGLQSYGGVPRIFNEILPRMCNQDNSLHLELLQTLPLRQNLPNHPQITHRSIPIPERYLRPRRLWKPVIPWAKHLVEKVYIGKGKEYIWHSTYFTLPQNWHGKSVVTVHDMIYEKFPELSNFPDRGKILERMDRTIQAADAIIAVSENTKKDLLEFYDVDESKITVVFNAVSQTFRKLEAAENTWEPPSRKHFIMYLGFRQAYKNFMFLLETYADWPGRHDCNLLVVGKPWSPNELRVIDRLKINDSVFLLQNISDTTLCRIYNRAAAFVFPSICEGFGIPLLEAMACGCPVIASRIPTTLEVAKECPIYFDPYSKDELIPALNFAIEKGRNFSGVQYGLERCKEFTWDKTAEQTLEIYKSLSI